MVWGGGLPGLQCPPDLEEGGRGGGGLRRDNRWARNRAGEQRCLRWGQHWAAGDARNGEDDGQLGQVAQDSSVMARLVLAQARNRCPH